MRGTKSCSLRNVLILLTGISTITVLSLLTALAPHVASIKQGFNTKAFQILRWHGKSIQNGQQLDSETRDKIQTLLLFIGYPRSGHTLIGSLLDAHPHIIIANEFNVIARWQNWTSEQRNAENLFNSLYRNSYHQSTQSFRSKSKSTGRSYFVRNQWQGRYKDYIKVIGDKKGGRTTNLLTSSSKTLYDIGRTVKLPIRIVHVVRNPFDNIATMVLRKLDIRTSRDKLVKNPINETKILFSMANYYIRLASVNKKLLETFRPNVITLHSEDIIKNPRKALENLCRFLDVICTNDYVEDCAAMIYKRPSKSRLTSVWPESIKSFVVKRTGRIPFLKRYSFDD